MGKLTNGLDQAVELVVLVARGSPQAVGFGQQVAFGVVGLGLERAVRITGFDQAAVGVVVVLGAAVFGVDRGGFVAGGVVFEGGRFADRVTIDGSGAGFGEDVAVGVVGKGCGITQWISFAELVLFRRRRL